jgi:long-chain acyl-CoA synthetase
VREPFERKTGASITEVYGLAEASGGVTANNFFGEREPGYIGMPLSGTDVRIFDADDFSQGPIETLGEEGTGEICTFGPQVMKGYLNCQEDNLKEWDGKKWLLTGDIGFMDEYGRFAIRDRKKQLIKMSGHSIFPSEVEELMAHHPAISEVAVAGVPDVQTCEAAKAWVSLKPGATATPEDLMAWAKENITGWKCPKYIEIIPEVPKSMVGKVQRRMLQENDPLFTEGQKPKE